VCALVVWQINYGESANGELAHMANRLWEIGIWRKAYGETTSYHLKGFKPSAGKMLALKPWEIFEVKDGKTKSLESDPACLWRVLHFSTYKKCSST